MSITVTPQIVIFITSMLVGWTGFLLGAIRWLMIRQIQSSEERLKAVEQKASHAAEISVELKDAIEANLKGHDKELAARCLGHSGRLTDTELKVERIGAEIRNLPQHRHIQELSERISRLHGEIHELSGNLKAVSRTADLINEFLINQGSNKK
ncbi:MAG: hypothetical protein ACOYL3_16150 [Desulfuromonadaceae bacterium]